MQIGIDYIGISVGALIFNTKKQVLLAKRSVHTRNEQGNWETPGGGVHLGETREQALIHEMKEKLDIEINIVTLLHTVDEIGWFSLDKLPSPLSFVTMVDIKY